jgi:lipid A 3-O-deacylase
MTNRLLLFVCGCAAFAASPCVRAGETHSGGQAKDPSDCWELTLESGYLWEVGHSTTIPYEIIPTQLVLRGPVMWKWWEGENGAKLIVRNRFATLFEDITVGPEDYYFGVNAAPSVELWSPSRDLSLFASVGGGVGVTNSDTNHHGLGQDFILNWFAEVGVRKLLRNDMSLLAAVYFTHHSDGGMNEPNPGIDALGFTMGLGWRF